MWARSIARIFPASFPLSAVPVGPATSSGFWSWARTVRASSPSCCCRETTNYGCGGVCQAVVRLINAQFGHDAASHDQLVARPLCDVRGADRVDDHGLHLQLVVARARARVGILFKRRSHRSFVERRVAAPFVVGNLWIAARLSFFPAPADVRRLAL